MSGTAARMTGFVVSELRKVLRDKVAVFFMVGLPIILVILVGMAFGGNMERSVPAGLIVRDDSAEARSFEKALRADKALELKEYADEARMRDAVVRGVVQYGVVVPDGFGKALDAGKTVSLTIVSSPASGTALPDAAIGPIVGERLVVVTAADAVSRVAGAPPAQAKAAAAAVAREVDFVGVRRTTARGVEVGGFQRAAYTMLFMFTTITALTSAGTFPEMRQCGVARRLLATPASLAELSVGLILARFVTILVSAVFFVAATALLFGVEWGNMLSGTVVIVVYCVAMAGLASLAGTFYSSPEQAGAIGAPVGIGLGMLGGAMWPLEIVPVPMRVVGHLTPVAWGIDAYTLVIGEDAGVASVWLHLVVLAGMTVVFFVLSGLRIRRVFAAA